MSTLEYIINGLGALAYYLGNGLAVRLLLRNRYKRKEDVNRGGD